MAKRKAAELSVIQLAKLAYLAYFASKQGDVPAPDFEGLMESTKIAWCEAANAVLGAIAVHNAPKPEPTEVLQPEIETDVEPDYATPDYD